MLGDKLRASIFALALSCGAVACNGAEPPVPHAPKAASAFVYSAKASVKTNGAMSVTRWHSTVGHDAKGTLAIDGQDSRGRVVFLATAHVDRKTKTVHVQSHLPEKGELVIDIQTHQLLKNDLPSSSVSYAKAMLADYAIAHPLHGSKAYAATALGEIAGGTVRVIGGALVFGGGFFGRNPGLQNKGGEIF